MEKDILLELNESQQNAVKFTEGPVMVIAGAGSGKTRVLTYRVAYLLQNGVDPFQILALTFTNKAANEMKERVLDLIGSSDAKNVWMGTFHSIFARLLRIEGHFIGYPSNFTIYDTDDSKSVIKSIVKELNLDPKVYQPNYIHNRISSAKNNLMAPQDYMDDPDIQNYDKASGKPMVGTIFQAYNGKCRKASAMDFDDLLFNTHLILRDFPEVLYKYQQKFRYILVDEYQDTNFAQYLILKKLAANNENICVVGDDAQSIYAFRGANIQNILNFHKDYPDAKVFKLEQNYRSTQYIVNAANSVIVNNKDQIKKTIWTENEAGKKIQLLKASTDNEEGLLISSSIFEMKMNEQLPNSDFAILYRTNAQSRALEEALRKQNIPYKIYGGLSFYKRKEIKDILAYYRLTINHDDEEALRRIINYPARGIGDTTIDRITVKASELGKSMWEVLDCIDDYSVDINNGIKSRIREFIIKIKSFSSQVKTVNAFDLGKHIAISSGIMKDLYEDKTPEGVSRFENMEELLNAIKDYSDSEPEPNLETGEIDDAPFRTLDGFMSEVSLLTDTDSEGKEDGNHVSLMTIHMAKGLEFPYVYIAGMEENLFPSIQSLGTRTDLEEERRLFYVALTRAKRKVTLSWAENRYRWGELFFAEPSRFIDEIDKQYIEFPQRKISHNNGFIAPPSFSGRMLFNKRETVVDTSKLQKLSSLSSNPGKAQSQEEIDDIKEGIKVEHERFGSGTVLQVEGSGPNKKATVEFPGVGKKQLLLKFARLKVVS